MKTLCIKLDGAAAAVLLFACAACQPARRTSTVGLVPLTGPPAEEGRRAGQTQAVRPAPSGCLASVRRPEEVKVYGVNRYIDPADSRLLHERHALYRVEQPSGWVTRQPDHQGELLLGP